MKDAILILVLVLTLLIFSVGCQPSNRAENGSDDNSGFTEEKGDNNTNEGNPNPDDNAQNPENDANNPENNDKTEDNDGLSPDNGNNSSDINLPEDEDNKNNNHEENPDSPSDVENGKNPTENNDGGETGENPPVEEPPVELPEIGTSVGYRFQDLTLETMEGGTINTADLRGKIVIVNIWADWCPPCRAELPDFNRIAAEYKDRVVIIAADNDSGQGTAKSYVETNFPETDIIFAYDTYYSDAYRAAGGNGYIPYTAIMDENGVIVYSDSGMITYEWLVNFIENISN